MGKAHEVPEAFRGAEVPRATAFEWKEEGQSVTGTFLRMKEIHKADGNVYGMAEVATEDGELKALPCGEILRDLLGKVAPGSRVHIVFVGKVPTASGKKANDFRVYALPAQ